MVTSSCMCGLKRQFKAFRIFRWFGRNFRKQNSTQDEFRNLEFEQGDGDDIQKLDLKHDTRD